MNVKVEKLLEYLIKDCLYFSSDSTYPAGLASSEPPTALILQD